MAEPKGETERRAHGFSESVAGGTASAEPAVEATHAIAEGIGETAAKQAETIATAGREGVRQATRAAESGTAAALRSSATIADGVSEIAASWVHYAEEVMRRGAQAGEALLRCRNWNEILDVQTGLLRDNTRAFFDQSVKAAEIGSRMAVGPFAALSGAAGDKPR